MLILSYFIWLYLISYAGSIISYMLAKIPFVSEVKGGIGANIAFSVITSLIAAVFSVLSEMFTCGLDLYFLNISTGRDAQNHDLFRGFVREPGIVCRISAFLMLPSILLMIPFNVFSELYSLTADKDHLIISVVFLALSLIVSLYMHLTYGLAFFFMLDFPSYSAGKILGITAQKMKGNRLRLFLLDIRFIPMIILGILSFGLGLLWVYPVIIESHALFFLNLMNPAHYIPYDERL